MTIKNNLRGYWDLDDNANDSHTTNRNGTATSITYVTGKRGKGASNATSGGGIAIPLDTFPTGTSDFTVNFWFYGKAVNTNGYPMLVGSFSTTTPFAGVSIFFDPAINLVGAPYDNVTFRCSSNSNDSIFVNNPAATTLYNKWTMITFMRSGNNIYAYYNITQVGTKTLSTTSMPSPNAAFIAGRNTNTAQSLQNGMICDMYGVWNRALSGSEIEFLYNEGAGRSYDLLDGDPLPEITISAATELTPTSAKLNGEVVSLASETSVDIYFQLRKVGVGTWTTVNTLNITEPAIISYTATNLEYETNYEYRLVLLYNGGEESIITSTQSFSTVEFGLHMTKVMSTGELVLAKKENLPIAEEGTLVYHLTEKKLKIYNGVDWDIC
jgi:hypothetical protein